MTHLRIEQNNGVIEEVSSSVITKLYEIAHAGLDVSSKLQGRLHTDVTYLDYIDYLTDRTNDLTKDLYITATDIAIRFADPEVLRVLLANNIGSNGMVTLTQANAVTSLPNNLFKDNTTVTEFDELLKFTNLHTIPQYCFSGCTNLTSVDLSNITSVQAYAFSGCSSLSMELDSSTMTTLAEGAFKNTGITKVKLSNLSSMFGNYDANRKVFYNCPNLTEADFTGSTITTIDGFDHCSSLSSITIPPTVTFVQFGAFSNTNISSFDFTNITHLGRYCFASTKLTSADLSGITQCDAGAFSGCAQLASITFPSISFSWVPDGNGNEVNLFRNCTALTTVDISNSATFTNGWFNGCTELVTCILPSNISTIYSDFFLNCKKLDSLGGKITPTNIKDYAFEGCTRICNDDIDLSSATYIGHNAFKDTAMSGVLNLTECLEIGLAPFFRCSGVTEIHAPKCVTMNYYDTWTSLDNLEVLDLPVITRLNICTELPKLTTINAPLATNFSTYDSGSLTLSKCPLLSTLNINFSAVTSLGEWCFERDHGLDGQYLEFPNVTLIKTQSLMENGINFIFSKNSMVTASGYGWFVNYTGTVYVPDNLVSTYKADSNWSTISSLIKGMSELPS